MEIDHLHGYILSLASKWSNYVLRKHSLAKNAQTTEKTPKAPKVYIGARARGSGSGLGLGAYAMHGRTIPQLSPSRPPSLPPAQPPSGCGQQTPVGSAANKIFPSAITTSIDFSVVEVDKIPWNCSSRLLCWEGSTVWIAKCSQFHLAAFGGGRVIFVVALFAVLLSQSANGQAGQPNTAPMVKVLT